MDSEEESVMSSKIMNWINDGTVDEETEHDMDFSTSRFEPTTYNTPSNEEDSRFGPQPCALAHRGIVELLSEAISRLCTVDIAQLENTNLVPPPRYPILVEFPVFYGQQITYPAPRPFAGSAEFIPDVQTTNRLATMSFHQAPVPPRDPIALEDDNEPIPSLEETNMLLSAIFSQASAAYDPLAVDATVDIDNSCTVAYAHVSEILHRFHDSQAGQNPGA